MAKVKTSELTDAALDWTVAKCEGFNPVFTRHYVTPSHAEDPKKVCIPATSWVQPFEPSTNWAQAGQSSSARPTTCSSTTAEHSGAAPATYREMNIQQSLQRTVPHP